jgi:plastocyanin
VTVTMKFPVPFLALLILPACGSSSDPGNEPNLVAHDVRVTQGATGKGPNAFSPANFTISLASQNTVKWLNRDFSGSGGYGNTGVTHRLVSDDGTSFASSNIPSNGTFVATLNAPGAYAYHCSIHPAMTGTVTVNP